MAPATVLVAVDFTQPTVSANKPRAAAVSRKPLPFVPARVFASQAPAAAASPTFATPRTRLVSILVQPPQIVRWEIPAITAVADSKALAPVAVPQEIAPLASALMVCVVMKHAPALAALAICLAVQVLVPTSPMAMRISQEIAPLHPIPFVEPRAHAMAKAAAASSVQARCAQWSCARLANQRSQTPDFAMALAIAIQAANNLAATSFAVQRARPAELLAHHKRQPLTASLVHHAPS